MVLELPSLSYALVIVFVLEVVDDGNEPNDDDEEKVRNSSVRLFPNTE